MTPKRWRYFAVLALVAAILAVFGQVRRHDFINFDDTGYVTANPRVKSGISREGLVWAFQTRAEANWHPITWLSHMLDCELFGLDAGGHHLTSVLLHVLNTLLLLHVIARMTGDFWRSLLVASLFGLHPLHVESVAWVAERKDVLSALFWILTMWAYAEYARRPGLLRYLPVLPAMALGLMAKPMLVTLPFVLLLLDYWPLNRAGLPASGAVSARLRWGLVLEKLPLLALSAASSAVTFLAQLHGGTVASVSVIPVATRLANAVLSYVKYIYKTFWPVDLAVFYPHSRSPEAWQVAASGLLLAGVTMLILRQVRSRPYLAVGWFWYLGTLVPVIGVVQVGDQAMADRYTYIPLIGLFLMLAWGVSELLARSGVNPVARSVSATALVALAAVCAWRQVGYWKNSESLFRHAMEVTEDNELARINYGAALVSLGKLDEAVAHLQEAIRKNPNLGEAHGNLAAALHLRGETDLAVSHYRRAVELLPSSAEAHNNLAVALAGTGRPGDASGHYEEALRLRPDYPEAHINLGKVLAARGQLGGAGEHFRRALGIDPGNPDARHQLGLVQYRSGEGAEAVRSFREALRNRPESPEILNNAAWILATSPDDGVRDAQESVRLAERACLLAGREDPGYLDTLAAALAAAGRFEDAVRNGERALALASSSGQSALAGEISGRLELYRAGRRYVEAGGGKP